MTIFFVPYFRLEMLRSKLERGYVPPELREVMPYYICATMFGWTPEEVDRQDAGLIQKLLVLASELGFGKLGELKDEFRSLDKR